MKKNTVSMKRFEEDKENNRSSKKRKKNFSPYKKAKYTVNKLRGYNNYLEDADLDSGNFSY